MHTKIQIFRNEVFGEIRTLTNEKGETFFVGKDVAKALGYSNTRKALLDHVDKEDKVDGVTIRDAIGRDRKFSPFVPIPIFCLVNMAAYLFHTFNKKKNSCIPSLLV